MFEELLTVYTLDNVPLLIASAITFGFGFWEYIYSFRLVKREGSAPFPIWMHTFYFAHDSTWAVLFFIVAATHGWHWFATGAAIALVVWTLFEVYNFYHAIKDEREEIWSPYYGSNPPIKKCVINLVCQIIVFYGLVNVFIMFVGEGCFFQWAAITNMVMATLPGLLWQRRGSRKGNGMGIALVILGGTINTFLPCGMFVSALPQYFDHPWFYLAGIVFTLVAIRNVVMVTRFPKKEAVPGEKRPIW